MECFLLKISNNVQYRRLWSVFCLRSIEVKWASFRESHALLPFQAIYTDFTYDCVCCVSVCVSIVVLSVCH